ncbi:hypothetical protein OAS67_00815 [Alphaproteobacteria bacterium]|nr:hypothetical protein [Alphaproteobacteria bacterium]
MSLIIIPLAGPDFYTDEFGIRPLYRYADSTVLQYVLEKRAWYNASLAGNNRFVFVLRNEPPHTEIMLDFIKNNYPKAMTVMLSELTSGALLSAIAGIALVDKLDEPVVIDLADISFDWNFDIEKWFANNQCVDAVIPYFRSTDSKFSYLMLDGEFVTRAREKQQISENASAGVYLFRNAAAYLRSVIFCLENPEICKFGSSLFVCPAINGIIKSGRKVSAFPVNNAVPLSGIFHNQKHG